MSELENVGVGNRTVDQSVLSAGDRAGSGVFKVDGESTPGTNSYSSVKFFPREHLVQ